MTNRPYSFFSGAPSTAGSYTLTYPYTEPHALTTWQEHATYQSIYYLRHLRVGLRQGQLSALLLKKPIFIPVLLSDMMYSASTPGEFRPLESLGEVEPQGG